MCDFQTLVTLEENLDCYGRECVVDTMRVVEVVPGVYYEYHHVPCKHTLSKKWPYQILTILH